MLTVDAAGERLGLTVSAVVGLSLEPPLVGVAVSRQAAMHELLREAGGFALSLLAGDQEDVAQHFARGVPPIALWAGIPLRETAPDDPPELDGAIAWLRGPIRAELETGDHTFFVAEVDSAELAPRDPQPLVFHRQSYASL